jgi:hypothetical protein
MLGLTEQSVIAVLFSETDLEPILYRRALLLLCNLKYLAKLGEEQLVKNGLLPHPSCVHPLLAVFVCATCPYPHTTSPCLCLPLFCNASPTLHTCMCPVHRVCAPPTRPYAPAVPPAYILTAMPFPPTFHVHVCTVPCFLACQYTYVACMVQKCF